MSNPFYSLSVENFLLVSNQNIPSSDKRFFSLFQEEAYQLYSDHLNENHATFMKIAHFKSLPKLSTAALPFDHDIQYTTNPVINLRDDFFSDTPNLNLRYLLSFPLFTSTLDQLFLNHKYITNNTIVLTPEEFYEKSLYLYDVYLLATVHPEIPAQLVQDLSEKLISTTKHQEILEKLLQKTSPLFVYNIKIPLTQQQFYHRFKLEVRVKTPCREYFLEALDRQLTIYNTNMSTTNMSISLTSILLQTLSFLPLHPIDFESYHQLIVYLYSSIPDLKKFTQRTDDIVTPTPFPPYTFLSPPLKTKTDTLSCCLLEDILTHYRPQYFNAVKPTVLKLNPKVRLHSMPKQ